MICQKKSACRQNLEKKIILIPRVVRPHNGKKCPRDVLYHSHNDFGDTAQILFDKIELNVVTIT